MTQLRKFTLVLPVALAIGACSSNRSSGDTGMAAGSLSNDTAAVRTDTYPVPGMAPGTMDSARMDSIKRDSIRQHHAATKMKKPY